MSIGSIVSGGLKSILGGGSDEFNQMKSMLAENRRQQMEQFQLQQIAERDSRRATTLSAIAKAKHDAMMAIANNIK
jgi:hypothetical protein